LKVGEGTFDKGAGVLNGYYWNGMLKRKVAYKNNQKEGKEIWYSENGDVEREVMYSGGRVVVH